MVRGTHSAPYASSQPLMHWLTVATLIAPRGTKITGGNLLGDLRSYL
jgi:hypothetical protein